MNLQYISDHNGKHTAVIVPINEWESLQKQNRALKELLNNNTVSLSQNEKNAIDEAFEEIKQGKFKTHQQVLNDRKKRFPQLFTQ